MINKCIINIICCHLSPVKQFILDKTRQETHWLMVWVMVRRPPPWSWFPFEKNLEKGTSHYFNKVLFVRHLTHKKIYQLWSFIYEERMKCLSPAHNPPHHRDRQYLSRKSIISWSCSIFLMICWCIVLERRK